MRLQIFRRCQRQKTPIHGWPLQEVVRIVYGECFDITLNLRSSVQDELDILWWVQLERREVVVDLETGCVPLYLLRDSCIQCQDHCS